MPAGEGTPKKRLEEILGIISADLGDIRLSPPDIYGVLADSQIRNADISRICNKIKELFPAVGRIECGAMGNISGFYIYLDPQPQDAKKNALAEWLRQHYPQAVGKVAFSFLSFLSFDPDQISTSVLVYDAARQRGGAARG